MKKTNLIVSLMLCGMLSLPAYAGSEDSLKHKTSIFLGHAEKTTKAAIYATIIAAGTAGFCASNYYLICKPGWKFYKNKSSSESHDGGEETPLYGKIFGGGVFDLASLAIMGYGLRGLKKVLDEKPQPERVAQIQVKMAEKEPEERIDKIVNGAKKAARFGARLWGYSFLTLFGAVGTGVGVLGGVSHVLPSKDKLNWNKVSFHNVRGNLSPDRTGAFLGGSLVGLPLVTIGIAGLIKTCKRKNAAKKSETNEVAIQTDETQEIAIQTDDEMVCQ